LRSTRIVIERCLSGGWISGEERFEECEGMDPVIFSRLHEAGDDTVGLDPLFGSGSETHLAEDDLFAKGLLSMVVCRGHPWDAKKDEEVSLLRTDEIRSEGF